MFNSKSLLFILTLIISDIGSARIKKLSQREKEVISHITVEAVVTVLEAPIFEKPNWRAKVVHSYHKGDTIKIHARAKREFTEFYLLLDPLGKPAYIPAHFIKVFKNDLSELDRQKLDTDPTDYRLNEPLPSTYPFSKGKRRRASVQAGIGQQGRPNYIYPDPIVRENYGKSFDLHGSYQRSPDFDLQERFYFGVAGYISTFENTFLLKTKREVTERWQKLGIGPHASWQFIKYKIWFVELGGGIYYNIINDLTVTQTSTVNGANSEERKFSKFSLSPFLNLTLKLQTPQEKIRILLNIVAKTDYPNQLTPRSNVENPSWWDPDEKDPDIKFNIDAALFFGVELNT